MVKSLGLIQWAENGVYGMPVSPSLIFCSHLEDSIGHLSKYQWLCIGKGGATGEKNNSLFVCLRSLGSVEFDFSGKPHLKYLAEGTEDVQERSCCTEFIQTFQWKSNIYVISQNQVLGALSCFFLCALQMPVLALALTFKQILHYLLEMVWGTCHSAEGTTEGPEQRERLFWGHVNQTLPTQTHQGKDACSLLT